MQIPGQQEISSYIVTVNYNDHLAVMNGDETIAEVTDGADFWRNSLGDFIFRTSSSSWTIRIANNGVTYIEVIELQHGDFIFRAQNNNGLYNKPKEKVESLKAVTEGETYTFTMPYCDVEVVATYRELYTVTWVNIDGTVLETDDNVEAGTIPEYNSENPVKDSCTFVGWTDGNNTYSINDVLPEVSGNITYKAVFAYADGMSARVVGHTISLDGDLGVNFYMELSPEIAASETAYMHFIIPNGNKTTEVDVPVSQATVKGNYYIFKCNVAAKDMDSTVTGRIIDGETYGTEYTYSVKQYADYLLEHADKNGTEQEKAYADAVPLVEKMLQYGAYAKEYFDKTNTLGNLEDVDIDIADAVIGEFTDGTTFEGVTLSLKSETTLSLYFKSGETLEFTCFDYDVETVISGGYQIARIRGIQAKNIGDMITLNVNGVTVEYSPLNYCRNVLENGNQPDSLKNVVKALYLYWQAAAVYFDVADLSALTGNYEAQDGDILTGTLVGNYKISIADGATVTLKNVNISCLANSSWFAGITLAGDATIILKDNNTVKGGYEDYPGIAVPEGKTLTIEGDGSLDAYSNGYGCGIGGGYNMSGGNIVINGGTITAAGGLYCAGIGSGCRSSCGNITINGGTVTATGGESAAGIGSGWNGNCGNILITSNVTQVTATKGDDADYSIGSNGSGTCGTVTIGGVEGAIEESPYTYQP